MNKKTILIMAALGAIQGKEAMAYDFSTLPDMDTTDPAVVAESLQVNIDTVRILKMFADMGALKFNSSDGSVQIDSEQLPNFLFQRLSESDEVVFDQENNVFILADSFINVLASQHIFSKLGHASSIETNRAILEELKERSTAIPREDQLLYSKASFIAGH